MNYETYMAHRKLVAAFVGIGALVLKRWTIDVGPVVDLTIEGVMALLTLWGVYAMPNEPEKK